MRLALSPSEARRYAPVEMGVFFPTTRAVYEIELAPNPTEDVACPNGDEVAKNAARRGYRWARESRAQARLRGVDARGVHAKIDEYCRDTPGGPRLIILRFPGEPVSGNHKLVDDSLEAAVGFAFLFHAARDGRSNWDDHFAITAGILDDGNLSPVHDVSLKYQVLSRWARDNERRVHFLYASVDAWTPPREGEAEYCVAVQPHAVANVKDLFKHLVSAIASGDHREQAPGTSSGPPKEIPKEPPKIPWWPILLTLLTLSAVIAMFFSRLSPSPAALPPRPTPSTLTVLSPPKVDSPQPSVVVPSAMTAPVRPSAMPKQLPKVPPRPRPDPGF
jgi:hypothetical protein